MKAVRSFSVVRNTRSAVIVAAKRTPVGLFMGKMSKYKAPELGSIAVRAAIESIRLDPAKIDEVVLGNVCQAGIGQNPARQASLAAGIPVTVPCTTINKVCASGLKSLVYAAQSILLGHSNIAVAGGFESMSNIPFYVPNYRKGHTFGNVQLLDGLAVDGLTDAYNNCAMGLCGEKTATDLKIDRSVQDDFAIASYERLIAATKAGYLAEDIVPIKINDKETVSEDEEQKKFVREKMPSLKPVFSKTGTITAGNASKINDGGCALIVMEEQTAKNLHVRPLARIVSYADAEVEPLDFCIAPAKAAQFSLDRAGLKLKDIAFHEINEAFAVTVLANMKLLDLSHDQVNVHGGAVALGHPIGMSGARIVQSLMTVLKRHKSKYGMASICNGGGGSSAIIIENLQ
eukprot:TRINITY_DN6403_c0_g1_i1.p1 TRINITY_DN6403_c0_g1~~TRINITY_DN6403_c0_g1_i1.p1  ORF type:complete len:402 (-),score=81.46 TRINITY_DN6403_c0_g1_i1:20-1225(-)